MAMTGHDFVVEAKAQIREIGIGEAKVFMAQGAVVLDVREPEEFAAGHLPGALHIPRGILEFKTPSVLQDATKTVLVYCKTGGRSALATHALNRMGYSAALSLAGGFDNWAAQGEPVDKPTHLNFD